MAPNFNLSANIVVIYVLISLSVTNDGNVTPDARSVISACNVLFSRIL